MSNAALRSETVDDVLDLLADPRARGVRAMLPHVDELRGAHNIHNLRELADRLREPIHHRNEELHAWRRKMS